MGLLTDISILCGGLRIVGPPCGFLVFAGAARILEALRGGNPHSITTPVIAMAVAVVWHRQKLVWMRNAVGNQLHALAMGEGVCRKKKLFSKKGRAELESLRLDRWASYRRQELLVMIEQLDASLKTLDQDLTALLPTLRKARRAGHPHSGNDDRDEGWSTRHARRYFSCKVPGAMTEFCLVYCELLPV